MLLLAAALLSACDEKDSAAQATDTTEETGSPDETGSPGETGVPHAVCADIPVDDCGSTPNCQTIDALPAQATKDGYCVEYTAKRVAVGCHDADSGCGDLPTLAASPDDPSTCWWFGNTCIPEGWSACADFDKWEECP